VQLFNCSSEQHTVEVWVQDMTNGTSFADKGRSPAHSVRALRRSGSLPFKFDPAPTATTTGCRDRQTL